MRIMKRAALLLVLLVIGLIAPATAQAAIPTLIQHSSHRNQNADVAVSTISPFHYKIPLVDPSLSGNALIMGISYETGKTISSIVDDQGQTWTLAKAQTSGSVVSAIYYFLNTAAGARMVTVTFTGATNGFGVWIDEWSNIATSSATDGTTGNSASSGTVTAGSFTPTTDGDLIINYVFDNADNFNYAAPKVSDYTPGSGFTLLHGNLNTVNAAQYTVQATHAAINPTMTVGTNTSVCNSVAVAFKSATAGTSPAAGIRVLKIHHGSSTDTRTSFSEKFPTSGNLILILSSMTDTINGHITAVSDTAGNTYTERSPGGDKGQLWEGKGAGPSASNILTFSVTYGNSPEAHFAIYDVLGAATSPFDHLETGTNTQTANADATPAPLFTPTVTNGLVVAVLTNGTGPTSSMSSPSGALFDTAWYNGTSDEPSIFDSGDGYSHLYPTSTSQLTFTYQETNAGVTQVWIGVAFGYKAPSSVTCRPTMTVLGVGQCG